MENSEKTKKLTFDYYKEVIDKKIEENDKEGLLQIEVDLFGILEMNKKLSKKIVTELPELYYYRKVIDYLYVSTNYLTQQHLE